MTSLEEFVAHHGQALLRLAFLLTGQQHSAEDLFQDCLLKLQRGWPRVRASNAPVAYAKRTLINEYISAKRRRWTSEVPVEDPDASSVAPRGIDFESDLVERDRMWSLLAELPERERAAVVLYYYEDLTDEDAGKLLGCRAVTVRSNRSRALERLRRSTESIRREELS